MVIGTDTLRFPESVFAEFLQITLPLVPKVLSALLHIRVLFTLISDDSKSKSSTSNANSSLIRKVEAKRVLQISLKRLLALEFGSVSK